MFAHVILDSLIEKDLLIRVHSPFQSYENENAE